MKLSALLCTIGISLVLTSSALSQLVVYSFASTTSPSIASASVASNLASSNFSSFKNTGGNSTTSPVSSGYTGASGGAGFFDSSWKLSGDNYFEFTLTPSSGYSISLTGISFGYRSSSSTAASDPNAFSIKTSANSYGADFASGALTQDNSWHLSSVTGSLTNITAPLTIRILAYGASTAVTTLRVDDVIILGTVSAVVPEPSAYAFIGGLAALGFVATRRRRSRRMKSATQPEVAG